MRTSEGAAVPFLWLGLVVVGFAGVPVALSVLQRPPGWAVTDVLGESVAYHSLILKSWLGSVDAMVEKGHDLRNEARDASYWWERAAGKGSSEAMRLLGLAALREGRADDGIAWLKRSARAGNLRAMEDLGHSFWSGAEGPEGKLEKNLGVALNWYMVSVAYGSNVGSGNISLVVEEMAGDMIRTRPREEDPSN